MEIFTDMKSKQIPLVESVYTAMIRCSCMNMKPQESMGLYRELYESDIAPKLRTFTPLFKLFSSLNDLNTCYQIYNDMMTKYKIIPTEKEYDYLLAVAVAVNAEYQFFTTMNSLIEDVYIPSPSTWDLIKVWFERKNAESNKQQIGSEGTAPQEFAKSPPWIITTSSVSCEGVVNVNNEQLRSIELTCEHHAQLLLQIEALATADKVTVSANSLLETPNGTQQEPQITDEEHDKTLNKGIKRRKMIHKSLPVNERRLHFNDFKRWLQSMKSSQVNSSSKIEKNDLKHSKQMERFDVVIDGANVGYFKQNFLNAPNHLDYLQINWVARRLMQLGFRPLIVLHSRHLNTKSLGLSADMEAVIEEWKANNRLYCSPAGCNDDW
jgi:pentatricopeptide repeat protein